MEIKCCSKVNEGSSGVQNTLLSYLVSWLEKRSTFFHKENVYGTIKSTLHDVDDVDERLASEVLFLCWTLQGFFLLTSHKENPSSERKCYFFAEAFFEKVTKMYKRRKYVSDQTTFSRFFTQKLCVYRNLYNMYRTNFAIFPFSSCFEMAQSNKPNTIHGKALGSLATRRNRCSNMYDKPGLENLMFNCAWMYSNASGIFRSGRFKWYHRFRRAKRSRGTTTHCRAI